MLNKETQQQKITAFLTVYLFLLTAELMLNSGNPFVIAFSILQKFGLLVLVIEYTKDYYTKKAFNQA
jgi:hypothetical protein